MTLSSVLSLTAFGVEHTLSREKAVKLTPFRISAASNASYVV